LQPGPGRPRATTPERILEIAQELFVTRGYAETSMTQIAEAAGVSRTTLFAYFGAKSDLMWRDFDLNFGALARSLESRPLDEEIAISVLTALVEVQIMGPERRALVARRWELIDKTPDLRIATAERTARYADVLAQFIADRRGEPVSAFLPQVVAHAALSASVAASRCWAVSEVAEPLADWIGHALSPLLDGYRAPLEEGRRVGPRPTGGPSSTRPGDGSHQPGPVTEGR